MGNQNKSYDLAFKLKVVSEVESGRESAQSASIKYGIGGSMTVYRWIAQKKSGKLSARTRSTTVMVDKAAQSDQELDKVKQLQTENEYLKLKILALETLIGVAEKDLGISLKKNTSDNPSTTSGKPEAT